MMTDPLYTENFSHMSPAWSRIFNFVADRAEGSPPTGDEPSSLDRLADFTRRILAVPKHEVSEQAKQPPKRKHA